MNRVKLSEQIAFISGVCCFAIALSIFLPFVKLELWGYDVTQISIFKFVTNSDIQDLISYTDYSDDFTFSIIVFIVAFIASVASASNFKINISLAPTIVMIIAAMVGKHMADQLTETIFQYGVAKKLIGATLLTWGYRILLWDSIAAFAVNFYLNYIASGNSQFAATINNVTNKFTSTKQTVKCPDCGAENAIGNKYCNGCGKQLPDSPNANTSVTQKTWFCSKCGCENSANSRFCDSCGNSRK